MYNHESESSFESQYHNHAKFKEYCDREHGGDIGFKVDLPKFSSTLQAEGFINLLNKVERTFYYKDAQIV